MSEQQNIEAPVFPSDMELIQNLISSYDEQLVKAKKSTEEAVAQLEQQFQQLKNNNIMIIAQQSLLETLKKDLAEVKKK